MKTVKLSNKAIEACNALLLERTMAENKLQAYLQGVMDTLKLEGSWNLNTDKWEFSKTEAKKETDDA